jgi:hypothetical protein
MILLEIIKNKLDGKTILIQNRWKLVNCKISIHYEHIKITSNNAHPMRLMLDEDFEIITKE